MARDHLHLNGHSNPWSILDPTASFGYRDLVNGGFRCPVTPYTRLTVSQVQPDHGHYETFRGQNSVLGESQHQTFEHFVADGAAGLPQQRPKVVAGRLGGVHALFEFLKRYLKGDKNKINLTQIVECTMNVQDVLLENSQRTLKEKNRSELFGDN